MKLREFEIGWSSHRNGPLSNNTYMEFIMNAWKSLTAAVVFAFLLDVEAQAQDTNPDGVPTKPLWELGISS